ncbi:MAG: hypothetical protein ACW98J_02585 [Candidatus Thorarchaeota archaeon]|jgi:hypothetical protein
MMQGMDLLEILLMPEFLITLIGMIGLFYGIALTLKTIGVLRPLGLERRYWGLVGFLCAFVIGYLMQILSVLGLFQFPVSAEMVVSFVYMGGAAYVVLVSIISLGLWRNVAGLRLSDEAAWDIFKGIVGTAPALVEFTAQQYSVRCDICNATADFSLADVINTHGTNPERGVEVQSGMGAMMTTVYPRHVCKDGIREIPVKLDDAFKYRAHGTSRPI